MSRHHHNYIKTLFLKATDRPYYSHSPVILDLVVVGEKTEEKFNKNHQKVKFNGTKQADFPQNIFALKETQNCERRDR